MIAIALMASATANADILIAATQNAVKKTKTKKVTRAKIEKPKSAWGFNFRTENEFTSGDFQDGGVRSGTSYIYLQATRSIGKNKKLKLQSEFNVFFSDNERTKESFASVYAQVSDSEFFKIGNRKFSAYSRTYLATDPGSHDNNTYGENRFNLSTKNTFGKFSVSATAHARYYFAGDFRQDGTTRNRELRLRPFLLGNYNFSDKVYLLHLTGIQYDYDTDFARTGEAISVNYTELGIVLTKRISIELAAFSYRFWDSQSGNAIYGRNNNLSALYVNTNVAF